MAIVPDHAWVPGKRWPYEIYMDGKRDGFNGRSSKSETGKCFTCKETAELSYEINISRCDFNIETEYICRTCWWKERESIARRKMISHEEHSSETCVFEPLACCGGNGFHCSAHRHGFCIDSAVKALASQRGLVVPQQLQKPLMIQSATSFGEWDVPTIIGIDDKSTIKNIAEDDDDFLTDFYIQALEENPPQQTRKTFFRQQSSGKRIHPNE